MSAEVTSQQRMTRWKYGNEIESISRNEHRIPRDSRSVRCIEVSTFILTVPYPPLVCCSWNAKCMTVVVQVTGCTTHIGFIKRWQLLDGASSMMKSVALRAATKGTDIRVKSIQQLVYYFSTMLIYLLGDTAVWGL